MAIRRVDVLYYFHLFILVTCPAHIAADEYLMGLLAPWNRSVEGFSALTSASAVGIAIDRIKNDPSFNETIELRVITMDSDCSSKLAMGNAVRMHVEHNVDVFIGPPCSEACQPVAQLASFWNKPLISWVAADPEFLDVSRYSTLARTLGPFNKMGKFLQEFLGEFGWTQVALFSSTYQMWYDAARAVRIVFEDNNVTITYDAAYKNRQLTNAFMDRVLKKIKQEARIVIICCPVPDRRAFLLRAHALGMVSGDYVFITMDMTPPKDVGIVTGDDIWKKNDAYDKAAKEAFSSVFAVVLARLKNEKLEDFRTEVATRMRQSPWKDYVPKHIDMSKGYLEADRYSAFLHDAVVLYAIALNESLAEGHNPRLGEGLVERMKNIGFQGVSGWVVLDNDADREPDYWIFDMDAQGDFFRVAEYTSIDTTEGTNVKRVANPRWPGGKIGWRNGPPDVPECGFRNDLCPEDKMDAWILVVAVVIPVIGLAFGVMFSALLYKKIVYENSLRKENWRIRWEEVEPVDGKTGNESQSTISDSDRSTPMLGTHLPDNTVSHSNHQSMKSVGTGIVQIFCKVGMYRGSILSVKPIKKEHIQLSRQLLIEFNEIKDLQHDNLNIFVGACIDPPNISLLWHYCSKGSLQDVLQDSSIKLDMTFKLSFMTDISVGMMYLHKTTLISHGSLKSSNCLVDGRWSVKITDYGLPTFTTGQTKEQTENEIYKRKLWTAPEILRENVPNDRGTQKGDVYSFGIIAYEISQRSEPFILDNVTSRDIVNRVRNGESIPFRPILPEQTEMGPEFIKLVKKCWSEDVEERPLFPLIRQKLRRLTKGNINIVDSVMKMMEKYANNLEEIVEERTTQLVEEQKKTDRLLSKMLPVTVAESLKAGHIVAPENYDQATIYFSDVVGFTTIASDSSPMQIVDFLNDLYSCFDNIIEKHDVYKVETIGDAYMVVSGVPIRNGKRHVVEIANCSLELLGSVTEFKIRHRPTTRLQLRIGLHTGPVVAGVVGNTMPRYCLFGDTVNMASRMESSGKPLGIHVSKQSYIALKDIGGYEMSSRGEVNIKGKGLQNTYWLVGKENQPSPLEGVIQRPSSESSQIGAE